MTCLGLAHQPSKNDKLLAQPEILIVPDKLDSTSFEPCVRVECSAQKHNAMAPSRTKKLGSLDLGQRW